MNSHDTVTVPSFLPEHNGRTTVNRPTVHEVVVQFGKAVPGAIVWASEETFRSASKAKRAAFVAWASGEHLEDDETEEVPA